MSSRNWVFTLNNPTCDELLHSSLQVKLLVASLERGEFGTPHYQGYLELTTSRNLSQVRAIFQESVHLEPRRGTRNQALSYALKTYREELLTLTTSVNSATLTTLNARLSNQGWNLYGLKSMIIIGYDGSYQELIELGQTKKPVSKRLKEIQKSIQDGASDLAIANLDFELYVKYHKAFSHYSLLCAQPRNFKTRIIVIQGPTGTGKSKFCLEFDQHAYWKPRGNWWDGYTGQPTCIIDEFYGWLPWDLLLRLADRYPLSVEYKGGSVNFCSKTIIITTNKHPNCWYTNVYFDAFVRRVDEWIVMGPNGSQHNTNYQEVNFINI